MSLSVLHYLCLVTLLSYNLANCTTTDDEEPRRTFPFRRAIDGTRGRKFYDPEDDGFLNSYGSSGRYDPDHQVNDFSDIRNNVPGEPGIDYPAYTRLPQTGFVCETDFRGYYADEEAGCQVFHVCDGSFLVSSFLCPMGSIFSQKLLTCDWWAKVDCSATRNYHVRNTESLVSEADDDEILRKAFEMSSVQSAGERIPAETVSQQQEPERQERRYRVQNYGGSAVTERINDLQTGSEKYSDYPDYPSRKQSRFPSRAGQKSRQRYQEDDYYTEDVEEEDNKQRNNSPIRVHTIGEDRRNDRTFGNEFQPSYAPTVPTVITTTRRFYSPTFPTTYRPSNEREGRRRFDLEFESSDHLYTARGRSDETIKAATAPSIRSKVTTSSENISLAMLINNADERRDEVENMQESESSYYRTTITVPPLQINTTKIVSSTEATIPKGVGDDTGKITEHFSILTIDNDDRNPDTFAYNQEEKPVSINATNAERTSPFAEGNSARIVSPETDKKLSKLAAFLQPPQEVKQQFQIRVLEDPAVPKNHHEVSKSKKLDKNNFHSHVEVIPSIEVPAIRITPPLFNGKSDTRESRVIRIFADKRNSSDSFSSIVPSPKKLDADDSVHLIEDSEGQHSETKVIAEKLPEEQEEVIKKIQTKATAEELPEEQEEVVKEIQTKVIAEKKPEEQEEVVKEIQTKVIAEKKPEEQEEVVKDIQTKVIAEKLPEEQKEVVDKINENKNSTNSAEIVSSKRGPSVDSISISSVLEQSHLIELINAAVALEGSGFNTAPETLVESTSTVPEENKSDDAKIEKSLPNSKISQDKNDEDEEEQSGSDKTLNAETKISQPKIDEHLSGSEQFSIDPKTIVAEDKKTTAFKESEVDLLNAKTTVSVKENGDDDQKPSNSEETLKTKRPISEEKHDEHSNDNKSTLLEAETSVGDKEKIVEHAIPEEILLTAASTVPEEKNSEGDEKTSDNKETVLVKTAVSQEKSIELSSGKQELLTDAKAPVTEDKNNADSQKSDETLLDTKTTISEAKNITKDQKTNGDDKNLISKTTVSQQKSIELSIVSEPIMFDPREIDPKEKITEEHSIGNEKTLVDTKISNSSNTKISEDHEHSTGNKKTLLSAKPADFEAKDSDNHERPSRSDEIGLIEANVEDSVVESSSPFQVTLTVNRDEELDPSGEVIRKLIAKQEIGDSVAAADYRNFEIVKSDQTEASKDGPHDTIAEADSRSGRRLALERDITEERLPNFRSNGLQSRNYYRNIVALVNGPNQPRPFSLESPHNVEVKTLSGFGGAVPLNAAPFVSGAFRNDLVPATTRIPVQETLQSVASSVQASEPLEKLSASAKIELSNKEELLDQLGQTFGERIPKKNNEKLIFELPQEQRALDFISGKPLGNSEQPNAREDDQSEVLRTTQKSNENTFSKTVVETEFIPSISFALNTEEEREEYMEAVMKGLLSDIRATESTNNDTNTSLER